MSQKVTANDFDQEVIHSETPVLVDFWAEWCGPCHAIAPVLEELAKEYDGKLKLAKLNVDENPSTAQQYQVSSIPNLKFFKDGEIVDESIGVTSKEELKRKIEKLVN